MGDPYKCIEGVELGKIGGSWFVSYCAYDINQNFVGQNNLPFNSIHWQNRRDVRKWVNRYNASKLWVLMPNGVVDKNSTTRSARDNLLKQGGISIHTYWCLWLYTHCQRGPIGKNKIGLSFAMFKQMLQQSFPYMK